MTAPVNGRTVKMMDAGTALFHEKDGFGCAIGAVKAEMDVYGKTLRRHEFRPEDLPAEVAECDLLLDMSSRWRRRLVACRVEDTGTVLRTEDDGREVRRYAAVFLAGDKPRLPFWILPDRRILPAVRAIQAALRNRQG